MGGYIHRWELDEVGLYESCRRCGLFRKPGEKVAACTVKGKPRSTKPPSRALLKRPKVELSLSPEAHEALERLAAAASTSRSRIVEALIVAADDEQKTQRAVAVFGGAIRKARRWGRFRRTKRSGRT